MANMKVFTLISAVVVSASAAGIDFQKLIDEAAAKGGGRVVVPRGTWIFVADRLTGPFKPVKKGPVPPAEFKGLDGRLRLTLHQPNKSPDERMKLFELAEENNHLLVK